MANLTVTATVTRKIITIGGITIGASLLLLLIYNVGLVVYRVIFPPKPPSAFVAFGKLPPVDLSEGYSPPVNVTYRIETVSGELKELKIDMKVFTIEVAEIRFGDESRTNSWASNLGFVLPAQSKTDSVATFASKDGSRTLKLGIIDQKATIDSDYVNDVNIIAGKHEDEGKALSVANKIVSVFGLPESEYPKGNIVYTKYKIDNGKLVKSNELSVTNLIQVAYHRGHIDKAPVVYPRAEKSKVWVLTTNGGAPAASIDITKLQLYKFSTYPLKGINRAFEELKAGKAGYNMEFKGDVFDIREVVLGYLDTVGYQPYLQPVYIFKGNDGVAAYVSAVSDAFIASAQQQQTNFSIDNLSTPTQ